MTRPLATTATGIALFLGVGAFLAYGPGASAAGDERGDRLARQLAKEREANAALVNGLRRQLAQVRRQAAPILNPTPAGNRALARAYFGDEYPCAAEIINGETGGTWRHDIAYGFRYGEHLISSGLAYGLGQARPGTKMLRYGKDAASNPLTQMVWFRAYAEARYGSVCGASAHWTPAVSW